MDLETLHPEIPNVEEHEEAPDYLQGVVRRETRPETEMTAHRARFLTACQEPGDQNICAICLESYGNLVNPVVTNCGHFFCCKCVYQTAENLTGKAILKCPMCVTPLRTLDSVASDE